jgi:hypothetical protein
MASVAVQEPFQRRQHRARAMAMKFGVPGMRPGYRGLVGGRSLSHEFTVDGKVFNVEVAAELRGLRSKRSEAEVTLDTQTKSYDGVDVGEARGWAVGGDIDGRMRVRIKRVFSLDVMNGRIRAKFRRIRQLTNSTANKGYSRRKITGDVTRFEYDSAYPLTVTTRDLSGHVLIAKSWELSGPEYWTAVTVAHEHVPKRPYTTDEILELAAVEVRDVSVVPDGSATSLASVAAFAHQPDGSPGVHLDLSEQGLSGIQVGLLGTKELSDSLAEMVVRDTDRPWILRQLNKVRRYLARATPWHATDRPPDPTSTDLFKRLLADITPSGSRYGVAQEILRGGTPTFLEARRDLLVSPDGLPIPLPPTTDGWQQALVIRLKTFNPRYETTTKTAMHEQLAETDPLFTTETANEWDAEASGGGGLVPRFGGTPHDEEHHVRGSLSGVSIAGWAGGGWGVGGESKNRATGGAHGFNIATYSGDAHQYRADAVYEITHQRWRAKSFDRFASASRRVRLVKVHGGVELDMPHVRALHHKLPVPTGSAVPQTTNDRRYVLHPDLAAVAFVERVDAANVVPEIERLLGANLLRGPRADVPSDLRRAVAGTYSKEAIATQYGDARADGVPLVLKMPTQLWRHRNEAIEHLQALLRVGGTTRVGIRVVAEEQGSPDYVGPRPDVMVTTGGQTFIQRYTGKARRLARHGLGFLRGRLVGPNEGVHLLGEAHVQRSHKSNRTKGRTITTRDRRRGYAKDTSQEFKQRARFRIEMWEHTTPNELVRRGTQLLSLPHRLVDVVSRGASHRVWQRHFGRQPAPTQTAHVDGSVNLLVPTQFTTDVAPAPIDTTIRASLVKGDLPVPSAYAVAIAPHVEAMALPGAERVASWAPTSTLPDRHAAAYAGNLPPQAPYVAGFGPADTDGSTVAGAFCQTDVKANIPNLLLGAYEIPLLSGGTMIVLLDPGSGRWVTRGPQKTLNFPEHTDEPEQETEEERGWDVAVTGSVGRGALAPIMPDAGRPIMTAGAGFGGGVGTSRKETNSAGDYVEANRDLTGDHDLYQWDATYYVKGTGGYLFRGAVRGGLLATVPATESSRLSAAFTDRMERPPFAVDDLIATAPGRSPSQRATAVAKRLIDDVGGLDALQRWPVRVYSTMANDRAPRAVAGALAARAGVPVEVLTRHDNGPLLTRHVDPPILPPIPEESEQTWPDDTSPSTATPNTDGTRSPDVAARGAQPASAPSTPTAPGTDVFGTDVLVMRAEVQTLTLDRVNALVNLARSRVSLPRAAPDALSDVLAVVRAWLAEAEDGWAQSAEFFAANSVVLRKPGAAAALRRMVEAEPDSSRLRVHAALLKLAVVDRLDDGFDYLTRDGPTDREHLLLEQARIGGDAATFAAFGTLVDGVDIRLSQEVSNDERKYAELMRAIALVLDGDTDGALSLATKARRDLDGISRAKWVVVLNGLAGELPTFALGLKSVQRTIVDCDRLVRS